MKHGAAYLGDGRCTFTVWAPLRTRVEVRLVAPAERLIPMERDRWGYWSATVEGVEPGARYFFRIDDELDRPDPASFFQPEGVHAASQVIDTGAFIWTDSSWRGREIEELIFYEIHVGTFTPEGTFAAVIPRLPYLVELGVTAVELMPVAQFPGSRNWGYDGVYPYAAQASYGGPEGLAALVDACHAQGLAVVLDVVYNHLGPEGNYLHDYGPYLTPRYQTPWGDAINYDGPYSDGVRDFFLQNALYWINNFHVDGLRLDAVHAIYDFSTIPFLAELAEAVHGQAAANNRRILLIAECDKNDIRLVRPPEAGGAGIDTMWSDDFHHALHTVLTGEGDGYYADYGELSQLAKVLREGFVYTGQYSEYRKRRHGSSTSGVPHTCFVVSAQNHDQVGNRFRGDRLTSRLSLEQLKLAAATVILSPFLPLLFMGEEYGETAPFGYFVEHSDPDLIEAVRRGRREEFSAFAWNGNVPDPEAEEVFRQSKLAFDLHQAEGHDVLFRYYRFLLRLRRRIGALQPSARSNVQVREFPDEQVLLVKRWRPPEQLIILLNFSGLRRDLQVPFPAGSWERILDSSATEWGGEGATTAEAFNAAGTVTLAVAPYAAVAFRMEGVVHDEP